MATQTKSFKNRDSATALLRKMGIGKVDFNKHITATKTGVTVTWDDGKEQLPTMTTSAGKTEITVTKPETKAEDEAFGGKERTDEPKAKAKGAGKKAAAKKAEKPAAEEKPERVTVASTVRDLVKAGKDNSEIWAVIQPQFSLGDDKKWYPAWYRADMKRKGLIK